MHAGVLCADLRGFTARSENLDSEEVSKLLRRFYGCAEEVLFPDAIIDKLIGDQVMALYLPEIQRRISRDRIPEVMLEHARSLLRAVGYGSSPGPFVEVGIGSTWAKPSWATSVSVRSTTSQLSATSSTRRRAFRGRPQEARFCSLNV